jgi:hypothetical protein
MAVEIKFGKNVRHENVTKFSLQVLADILQAAGLSSALISSTARTPAEQAGVMLDNIELTSVAAQRELYSASGDAVVDEYIKGKKANKTRAEIVAAMEAKIIAIGASKVTPHAADPKELCAFSVAPYSIANKAAFENAVRADRRVSKFLMPPLEPGYYLQIPQPKNG